MTPKSSLVGVILSVTSATLVSFIVSAILLKKTRIGDDDELENATKKMRNMKSQSKSSAAVEINQNTSVNLAEVRNIIVACDAGMGSSAMGAGVLAKKVRDAGLLGISVSNMAINDLPDNVDIVITHKDLTQRAKTFAPNAMHISLTNFLDSQTYNDLVTNLIAKKILKQQMMDD